MYKGENLINKVKTENMAVYYQGFTTNEYVHLFISEKILPINIQSENWTVTMAAYYQALFQGRQYLPEFV